MSIVFQGPKVRIGHYNFVTIIVLHQSHVYFLACQRIFVVVVYFGVGSCALIRDVTKGRLLAIFSG